MTAPQPEFSDDPGSDWSPSSRRERYLSEASAALLSSLDADSLLKALVNVLVPSLAGACYIELLPENAAELAPSEASELRQAGTSAVVSAPILAGGRVIGTLTLIAASPEHALDEIDDAWLAELGRRTGAALTNAELYREAQTATRRAEAASLAKDEFLATACHELRTPLNAVHAWLSLLASEPMNDRTRKAVEVIERNALIQQKLIDDVLDMARLSSGKLRLELAPVDLGALARAVVGAMTPTAAARRVTVSLVTSDSLPCVLGDSDRLQQVIFNLLSNAIKFSNIGGVVRVAFDGDGDVVVLSVMDDGRGIEPEFLPYVFDRLSQADGVRSRRSDGLGIGLSLVRHIVELHGGRVHASSPGVGLGTTVSVSLPIAPSKPG